MRYFHCTNCQQVVYYENTLCLACGSMLAFLQDEGTVAALVPAPSGSGGWVSTGGDSAKEYRLCGNYAGFGVCNWAMPVADGVTLCRSCNLTRILPNLDLPANRSAWSLLEGAKRRLLYTLDALHLPVGADASFQALSFEFLADRAGKRVFTGHSSGRITLNIAEADDTERERRRVALGEPYRTLLGHFRHESGHYYWERLVQFGQELESVRHHFGDETADYSSALKNHYAQGAPADWQNRFISSYASAHPWEDWAETWAHYLHMTDTLETATAGGVVLREASDAGEGMDPFDSMIARWIALTHVLNSINRSMGLRDIYPFVLSQPVVEKLRVVHRVVGAPSGS